MHWSKEAKDTLWLIGLQGANYLVPLLVWPYLMYSLGAEGFGIYSFGIALAQYVFWNANTLIKYKTKAIEKWRITYCS